MWRVKQALCKEFECRTYVLMIYLSMKKPKPEWFCLSQRSIQRNFREFQDDQPECSEQS